MKKQYGILLLSLCMAFSAFGQKDKHEQIRVVKVGYLTQELGMSATEAQTFWPIYNAYEEQAQELRKLERKIKKVYKREGEVSPQEAQQVLADLQAYYRAEERLKNKLIDELLEAFDPAFVLRFKIADYNFRMKLLSKYREQKN